MGRAGARASLALALLVALGGRAHGSGGAACGPCKSLLHALQTKALDGGWAREQLLAACSEQTEEQVRRARGDPAVRCCTAAVGGKRARSGSRARCASPHSEATASQQPRPRRSRFGLPLRRTRQPRCAPRCAARCASKAAPLLGGAASHALRRAGWRVPCVLPVRPDGAAVRRGAQPRGAVRGVPRGSAQRGGRLVRRHHTRHGAAAALAAQRCQARRRGPSASARSNAALRAARACFPPQPPHAHMAPMAHTARHVAPHSCERLRTRRAGRWTHLWRSSAAPWWTRTLRLAWPQP